MTVVGLFQLSSARDSPSCRSSSCRIPTGDLACLDPLLRRIKIPWKLVAVVDDDVGLKLEAPSRSSLRTPSLWHRAARPRRTRGCRSCRSWSSARGRCAVDVIDEAPARGFVRGAARAIRMMPVHQRIVEAHAQALGARGLDVLLHQVAARALLGRAIVCESSCRRGRSPRGAWWSSPCTSARPAWPASPTRARRSAWA